MDRSSNNMSSYDLPVLRSHGFEPGQFGASWFKKDKEGDVWQVYVDEESNNVLVFRTQGQGSIRLTRDKFDKLFA